MESAPWRVPAMRLDNQSVWDALLPRLQELVSRGSFILGEEVSQFERAAMEYFRAKWCVGTSSGTSALVIALRISGLQAGARIAIPANTFFATFEAVVHAGYVPVIVDQEEDHLLNLDQLSDLDLSGAVAVHLYGLPVDMPRLMDLARRSGWWIVEDCSQAHGASIEGRPVGSFGNAAAFSAYPTKNLGAWGDAGFVLGVDPSLQRKARILVHHGQEKSNVHEEVAGTDRLDSLQALVLTEKLKMLDGAVARRRHLAAHYRDALAASDLLLPGDRGRRVHAFHQFVVRVPRRSRVRSRLAAEGIETAVHYPTPIHLQPAAREICLVPSTPFRAEQASREVLSLPIYPSMPLKDIRFVAERLIHAVRQV